MRSSFSRLCAELNARLRPALIAAGYEAPPDPFGQYESTYEFKRPAGARVEVVAFLFAPRRRPLFGIQLYHEPAGGLGQLVHRGGDLAIASVSRRPTIWPLGVVPFGIRRPRLAALFRQRAISAARAVDEVLARLPDIEAYWATPQATRYIVVGTLHYPGVERRRTPRN